MQTVDFFTPIVDDPYTFGLIAAANALSDVYAMGGKPLTALNIICFPASCQPLKVMEAILHGGYDKVREAGAVMVGGHSVEDSEPKYGLAVTGLVDPRQLVTSGGACPGDRLVLTKPLGTGIISTALKGEIVSEKDVAAAIDGMCALNAAASEAMLQVGISACTDVTGFSLLGHLYEMLLSGGVGAEIDHTALPLYPAVREMVAMGMIPAGAYRNLDYMLPHISWEGPADKQDDYLVILADPQTSGGLLVALPDERVALYLKALEDRGAKGYPVGKITPIPAGKIIIV